MTTLHRTKASPQRKIAKRSADLRSKRRANRRRDASSESPKKRRYRQFAPGVRDDGRGAPRAGRDYSSAPDGDGRRAELPPSPTRPVETAWENPDKDGCGGQSPWSDAEIAIRRRAGEDASVADDDGLHPSPSEDAHARSGGTRPEDAVSTD